MDGATKARLTDHTDIPKTDIFSFSVSGVFSSNPGLKETKKHRELGRSSSALRLMTQLPVASLISNSTKQPSLHGVC